MEELASALGKASSAPWAQGVAHQLNHAEWAGFHCLDLVFPMFVFAAGVSCVYSLTRVVETAGRAAAVKKAVIRAVILFALGIFCYGGISKELDGIRWLGVLQRIALCTLGGALAFLYLRPRGIIVLTISLLAGYWALMTFVPVPGVGAGNFAEGRNLANWLDQQLLPGFKWDGDHDPEGLLSTLPAMATALLGVLTGIFIRGSSLSMWSRSGVLIAAGAALAGAGWLWHPYFPIIKKVWSSSFVLVTGGYSMIFLGVFMAIIDGAGWKKWAVPFVWIGMNPITLFLSHHLIQYGKVAERIGGGPVSAAMGVWGPVWIAFLVIAQGMLLAWFLYRRKIFLRV